MGPILLPGAPENRTAIPPSLKLEMETCSPSPFWNRKYAAMFTGSRTDRRRSRFIRARAARKLDFAFSVEMGLKITKFAPSWKAACKLVRASMIAIAMDLLLRCPERMLFSSPKLCSSLQSMMTAPKVRWANSLAALTSSAQCSTSISNSPRTLRSTRKDRSSEQINSDVKPMTL